MTRALEEAFREAAKLPPNTQDQLAAAIQAEIAADSAWEKRLARSSDALESLADEALAEHRSGETRPLSLTPR